MGLLEKIGKCVDVLLEDDEKQSTPPIKKMNSMPMLKDRSRIMRKAFFLKSTSLSCSIRNTSRCTTGHETCLEKPKGMLSNLTLIRT